MDHFQTPMNPQTTTAAAAKPDPAAIGREIAALSEMTVRELQEKWVEVWRAPCRAKNKDFLRKRIAWKIQANAYGGLSQRALERARELADETLLKIRNLPDSPLPTHGSAAPEKNAPKFSLRAKSTPRLPMPGTIITRIYRRQKISVLVLVDGFEWNGQKFATLSAVAKAVTGSHWNGFLFFGLSERQPKQQAA